MTGVRLSDNQGEVSWAAAGLKLGENTLGNRCFGIELSLYVVRDVVFLPWLLH